ncbi:MAG: DJ-1/PfpI family protein, partial [Elusimicrobia bacterium]|nr:DJ-1/PfpI family protein [Elusimicrobiota bacterium]
KKIVAAICHGPWIMISAKIVKGRKITAYEGIKDDVLNAGADYVNADVVVDDNFVTSPHYRNNGDFMREVLKKFNG